MLNRIGKLALVTTLGLGLSGFAWAQDEHRRDDDRQRVQDRDDHDRDHDRDRRDDRGYRNQAYQQGFQDGRIAGEKDRRGHHSFRPEHDENYRHADRGYNSGYGRKDDYRQQYRSGFTAGYQEGYGRR